MRRPLRSACLALAVGLPASLLTAQSASAAPAAQQVLTGSYRLIAVEPRDDAGAGDRLVPVLETSSGTFELSVMPNAQPGSRLRVHGRAGHGTLSLSSSEVVAPAPPPSVDGVAAQPTAKTPTATPTSQTTSSTITPARRLTTLVILATWTAPDSVTPASAQANLSSADQWYARSSYGAIGFGATATNWLSIAGPDGGLCWTNRGQIQQQAEAAAVAAGYDPASYDREVIYFPQSSNPDCSSLAGWAQQPGRVVTLNGTLTTRTSVHELGHTFGLAHAHTLRCSTATGSDPLAGTCSTNEYGDAIDAMGDSGYVGDFSSAEKDQLGWMSAGRLADLSAGGSTTVAPLTSQTGTTGVALHTGTRTYYLEARNGQGNDAALPSVAGNGVFVRVVDSALGGGTFLLNMTGAGDATEWALPAGRGWTTPEGFGIRTSLASAAGLQIDVSAPAGDTTGPAAPSGVTAVVGKSAVTLTWTPAVALDAARYTVRYAIGTAAPMNAGLGTLGYTGASTSVSVPVTVGRTAYTFVVFPQDAAGNYGVGSYVTVSGGKVSVTGWTL